jgi:hypothetical protein
MEITMLRNNLSTDARSSFFGAFKLQRINAKDRSNRIALNHSSQLPTRAAPQRGTHDGSNLVE